MRNLLISIALAISFAATPVMASQNPCVETLRNSHEIPDGRLMMDNCQLNDSDLHDVIEYLASHQFHIDYYSFNSNSISDTGTQELVNYLKLKRHATGIYLSRNKLTDESAKLLAQLPLVSLALASNQITAEGAKAIAQNQTISNLDLSNNNVGDDGAITFASRSQGFQMLYLANNQITKVGAIALASQGQIDLDLSNNSIGDEGAKAFASYDQVDALILENVGMTDDGAKAFASTHISTLDLSKNPITNASVTVLTGNANLMNLALVDTDIDDAALITLTNSQLSRVTLGGTSHFTHAALQVFARKLTMADIGIIRFPLTHDDVSAFTANPNLSSLSMIQCGLSDEDVIKIAKNEKLMYLQLQGNAIGDPAAFALAEFSTTFRDITLSTLHMSQQGLNALKNNKNIYLTIKNE